MIIGVSYWITCTCTIVHVHVLYNMRIFVTIAEEICIEGISLIVKEFIVWENLMFIHT